MTSKKRLELNRQSGNQQAIPPGFRHGESRIKRRYRAVLNISTGITTTVTHTHTKE
jgi:hypothetical protein